MGKFDGILICTDLDGTLLRSDKTISRENLEAIEHFKSEGGYFTFITGRMPYFVGDMLEKARPNAPFGCIKAVVFTIRGKKDISGICPCDATLWSL